MHARSSCACAPRNRCQRFAGARHAPGVRRSRTIIRAHEPPEKPEKATSGKADISALWALRLKKFLSRRREYLEQAELTPEETPFVQQARERVEKAEEDVEHARDKIRELELAEASLDAYRKGVAAEQAVQETNAALRRSRPDITNAELPRLADPYSPETVEADMRMARSHVHATSVKVMVMPWLYFVSAMRQLVLLPFTVYTTLLGAWHKLFASQRYQNFLFAEGERIWYWRNRTENERWFWEIYFTNHLLIPIVGSIAYQYFCPANFVWVVLVPVTFAICSRGELLGPDNLTFWLHAYFGVYLKLWPQWSQWLQATFAPWV